jgi:hypothetical protein
MPIIGPILFSLFIFSPLVFPTEETNKNPELPLDSIIKKPPMTNDQSSSLVEISDKVQHPSFPK